VCGRGAGLEGTDAPATAALAAPLTGRRTRHGSRCAAMDGAGRPRAPASKWLTQVPLTCQMERGTGTFRADEGRVW
jgi:hypothetical protein